MALILDLKIELVSHHHIDLDLELPNNFTHSNIIYVMYILKALIMQNEHVLNIPTSR